MKFKFKFQNKKIVKKNNRLLLYYKKLHWSWSTQNHAKNAKTFFNKLVFQCKK